MRKLLPILILFTILSTTLSTEVTFPRPEEVEEGVTHLNQDTFEKLVNAPDSGSWFIMFHAPWCPHCRAATPVWKDFAKSLNREGVRVGMVNCEENPELAGKYGIQGYPTFMFIEQGRREVFNGIRTVDAWTQFINEKKPALPTENQLQAQKPVNVSTHAEIPTSDIVGHNDIIYLDKDNFDQLVNSPGAGPWFIMFFMPGCPRCGSASPAWRELPKSLERGRVKVGMVNSEENQVLANRYTTQDHPNFIFFDQGRRDAYYGPNTVEAWKQFVEQRIETASPQGTLPSVESTTQVPNVGAFLPTETTQEGQLNTTEPSNPTQEGQSNTTESSNPIQTQEGQLSTTEPSNPTQEGQLNTIESSNPTQTQEGQLSTTEPSNPTQTQEGQLNTTEPSNPTQEGQSNITDSSNLIQKATEGVEAIAENIAPNISNFVDENINKVENLMNQTISSHESVSGLVDKAQDTLRNSLNTTLGEMRNPPTTPTPTENTTVPGEPEILPPTPESQFNNPPPSNNTAPTTVDERQPNLGLKANDTPSMFEDLNTNRRDTLNESETPREATPAMENLANQNTSVSGSIERTQTDTINSLNNTSEEIQRPEPILEGQTSQSTSSNNSASILTDRPLNISEASSNETIPYRRPGSEVMEQVPSNLGLRPNISSSAFEDASPSRPDIANQAMLNSSLTSNTAGEAQPSENLPTQNTTSTPTSSNSTSADATQASARTSLNNPLEEGRVDRSRTENLTSDTNLGDQIAYKERSQIAPEDFTDNHAFQNRPSEVNQETQPTALTNADSPSALDSSQPESGNTENVNHFYNRLPPNAKEVQPNTQDITNHTLPSGQSVPGLITPPGAPQGNMSNVMPEGTRGPKPDIQTPGHQNYYPNTNLPPGGINAQTPQTQTSRGVVPTITIEYETPATSTNTRPSISVDNVPSSDQFQDSSFDLSKEPMIIAAMIGSLMMLGVCVYLGVRRYGTKYSQVRTTDDDSSITEPSSAPQRSFRV